MAKTIQKNPSFLTSLARTLSTWLKMFKALFRKTVIAQLNRRPLSVFVGLMALILILILVGDFFRRPNVTPPLAPQPKPVRVYSIGQNPKVSFQGKVEKSGSITISAFTGGVVRQINHQVGNQISSGTQLFWIASNWTGGSIPTLSRQLAEAAHQTALENYPSQLDAIEKRRQIAQTIDTQFEDLRTITADSIDDTQNLINLNQDIVNSLESQLAGLEATNTDGANDSAIQQVNQVKAGVLAGLNSLKSALRNTQYQTDTDKAPTRLADLTRETTLTQLDIEARALNLSLEVSQLNLDIARVSQSLMSPASPCSGTLERIYVHPGQTVGPGTPLAKIACSQNLATIVVPVSNQTAASLSLIDSASIMLGGQVVEVRPANISTEPTEGSLHSVIFQLSQDQSAYLTDGAFVTVSLPITSPRTTAAAPFIPLDTIYQSQSQAYVFVVDSSTPEPVAHSQTVELGQVFGGYVEVFSGLNPGDQIIVDRTVINSDPITIIAK